MNRQLIYELPSIGTVEISDFQLLENFWLKHTKIYAHMFTVVLQVLPVRCAAAGFARVSSKCFGALYVGNSALRGHCYANSLD